MIELQDCIFNISMVIATMWIVDHFWKGFFEVRKKNLPNLCLWIAYFMFQLFFEYNRGDIHIWMVALNIGFLLTIGMSGYCSTGRAKYFLLLLFYALWSLTEVFVVFLMRLIALKTSEAYITEVVISKIIMLLFVYILPYVRRRKKELFFPNPYSLMLLFIPFGSIWIAVNEVYAEGNVFFSVITISLVLLFNVLVFEVYTKLNAVFLLEREKAVYARQLEAVAQSTAAQKKWMQEFQEEKHNLINKLIALRSSLESSDQNAVGAMLDRIIDNSHMQEIISDTGNNTVDAIINFKYAIAKEYGIKFDLKICVPEDLPIEQCDLGVVIGNALDNAIEATKEYTTEEKRIQLFMGIKKEALVLVIKNPFEGSLRTDREGHFLSTKKDTHHHGFGLTSIQKIAEKYHGTCLAEAKSPVFCLTVVMYLPEI